MVRKNATMKKYILNYNKEGSTVTTIKKWDIIKEHSFNISVENARSGKIRPIIDPNVLLLPRKDATLFGTLPKLENRVYSKCIQCNRVFNPVDILSHCSKSPHFKYHTTLKSEIKHKKEVRFFKKPFPPPPSPTSVEPMSSSPVEVKLSVMRLNPPKEHNPSTKAISSSRHTFKSSSGHHQKGSSLSQENLKSSSLHHDHSSTSPSSNSHSNKHKKSSSSSPRKSVSSTAISSATSSSKVQVKDYDPDVHCGVIEGNKGAPCMRSITCSYHKMQLRKLVPRSKDIHQLIAERKAAKEKDSKHSAASYTAPNEEAKESLNQHTSYVPVVAKIATTNATIEQQSVSNSYVPIMPRAVNHTRQLATSLITSAMSMENEKKSPIALTNGYVSHTQNSENMQDNVGTVPVLVQVQFLQINNYIVSLESPQSAGSKPLTKQSVVLPIQNNSNNVKMYKSHPKPVMLPTFEARRVGGSFLLANPLLESERNELLTALNRTRETIANNNRELCHINNSGNRTNCKRPASDTLVTRDSKTLIIR
ncbi:uncharacterized serine-rich protein C215.13-like [Sitophilus oryzae]|uniref:Uncharacterized serine-rich protein C215.13-like n=1 Tax=Sitophilus oryzae TaxID=7048 RepID=A0A6J2XAW7_SITOR|nr:uncharacterized serine-rich protein C215.13-like [Sitophilus oryzae]XP_030748302.1 uncharacterized serine-rich protein C215.13-like [Sitophilus oryzae]